MRILGIDPGSLRTGYGCVDSDGTRHHLVTCGALIPPAGSALPERLHLIHQGLAEVLRASGPSCVVIENVFHAKNVKSALTLGHARGVAMLAAVAIGVPVVEYSAAEIKLALAGYGRAEKGQIQHMVTLLLGLDEAPTPYDVTDALAVAICHAQTSASPMAGGARAPRHLRSWRHAKLAELPRRQTT